MRYINLFTWTVLLLAKCGECKLLRWRANTDFDNPINWKSGRVPCRNQHVQFPLRTPPVYIQTDTTLMELVLPSTGVIILGDDASILFPVAVDNDATCREEVTEYVGDTPRSWFDPRSWCEVSVLEAECLSSPPSRLDVERVPCVTDTAVFPSHSGFIVTLETDIDIQIARLHIADQDQTTSGFKRFLDSTDGKSQFVRDVTGQPTTLTLTQLDCTDVTGCTCDNDFIEEKLCSYMRPCESTHCDNPITASGQCCHFCGAVLDVEYGSNFRLKTLENMIKNIYNQMVDNDDVIKVITSKITEDHIQVVVWTNDTSDTAVNIGYELKSQLEADMKTKKKYRVTGVSIQASGTSTGQTHRQEGLPAGERTAISIVIPLAIIILVVVIVAMYCLLARRRHTTCWTMPSWLRKQPKRHGSVHGGGDLELSHQVPGVYFDNNTIFDGNLTSFRNPVFDDQHQMEKVQSASVEFVPALYKAAPLDVGPRKGITNPLYDSPPTYQPSIPPAIPDRPPAIPDRPPAIPDRVEAISKPPIPADSESPDKSQLRGGLFRLRPGRHQRFDNNHEEDVESRETPGDTRKQRSVFGKKTGGGTQPASEDKENNAGLDKKSKKKTTTKGFPKPRSQHQRFENSSGSESSDEMEKEKGFGNPLYSMEGLAGMEVKERTPPADRTGFDNPLFEDQQPVLQLEGAERLDTDSNI